MSDQPYYGPAGLFSTDNPQSDQMQILAESYDEDELEDDHEDWDEEYYNQPTAMHTFECSVHGSDAYLAWEEFPYVELDHFVRQKQAEHDEVCDCGQPIKVQ